jgi:hypothetical protein
MIVYRYGNLTPSGFTPRPGHDTEGSLAGLSTFTAPPTKGRAQAIETDKLAPPLRAFPDRPTNPHHVSIAPADPEGNIDVEQLREWAASRGGAVEHRLTQLAMNAVVRRDVKVNEG